MTSWPIQLLALLPFYLLGAFPSGYLLAKRRGIDILHLGSGNVGATNVARHLGANAAVFTLLLDIGKGALAVMLGKALVNEHFACVCGLTAVCGHCFSIPSKLKGGKGVATGFGVIAAMQPWAALAMAVMFAFVFTISHFVSLASLSAFFIAPLAAGLISGGSGDIDFYCMAAISLVVMYRHKANLNRLWLGTESRLELKDVLKLNRGKPDKAG